MSSSEDEGTTKRAEIKKLVFLKNQELKKCKSKQDREKVESKYAELERILTGKPIVAVQAPVITTDEVPVLYGEGSKVPKSQQKKDKKQEKLIAQRLQVIADVGDGSRELELRKMEMRSITRRLPSGFSIAYVEPNGDCMFESVCMHAKNISVSQLRQAIASYIKDHREEFEVFIPDDLEEYCDGIRRSAWGSEVELEVSSRLLDRPVHVLTQDRVVEFGADKSGEPIRVSFHERQYSSCHYNGVINSGSS